jgi:glucan endo-1,3-alpha-glucosidase
MVARMHALTVLASYTYRLVDWMTDLALIEEAGFDAIALNTGPCVSSRASAELATDARTATAGS